MDTFFARNRMSAYLDGSLPDSEAAEVEAALAEDPALRQEFADMRRAVDLLRTAGPARAPEGFHARVMAAVDSEPAPGGVVSLFRRTLHRVPVEALALAAAAVIVVVVIQGRTGDELGDDVAAQLDVQLPSRSLRQEAPAGDDAAPDDPVAAQNAGPEEGPPATDKPSGLQPAGATTSGDTPVVATSAKVDGDLRTGSSSQGSAASSTATASTRSSKKKLASAKGIDPEGQPYYSDWEQQDDPAEQAAQSAAEADAGAAKELSSGIDMAPPRAFRLAMADSEVLYELSAAAERVGGRLTDSSGAPLAAHELTANDTWLRVQLVVPQAQTDSVTRRLRDMGGVAIPPPGEQAIIYGPETTVFIVEVSHQP